MGKVSVALDRELNREVAFKEIQDPRADEASARARFVREAEVTGKLEHPGIVPVYSLGATLGGRPFYTMRFIRGESLKEAIGRFHADTALRRDVGARNLAWRELLRRFVDVCNAMQYAHDRGVLHRDLKPENVMVGKYGETLIVDWGLAKTPEEGDRPTFASTESGDEPPLIPSSARGADRTVAGSVIGTPAYMPPEQANGRLDLMGPASDVYSLGATLYHLLTGVPPFSGEDPEALLTKVRKGDFRAPRAVDPSIAPGLEAVCSKAMGREPRDRYTTAQALADDIERWMADEAVLARRETIIEWAKRETRKRQTLVISVGLGLAAGLIVLGFTLLHVSGLNRGLSAANRLLDRRNDELLAANRATDAERSKAERRGDMAIEAVRRFGDAVEGNRELRNNPALDSLRKELLKQPLDFFQKLKGELRSERDTRPVAIARLARANADLAHLNRKVGQVPDAVQSLREAVELTRALSSGDPGNGPHRRALAAYEHDLGVLLEIQGDTAESRRLLEGALAIQEALVEADPENDALRIDLANTCDSLGISHGHAGDRATGLAFALRARDLREALWKKTPDDRRASRLAAVYNNLGGAFADLGRYREGLESYERAVDLRRGIRDRNPEGAEALDDLAGSLSNLAAAYQARGEVKRALEIHDESLEQRRAAVALQPTSPWFWNGLALGLFNKGAILSDLNQFPQARDSYREAKEIRERLFRDHPGVVEYAAGLASTCYALGIVAQRQGDRGESWELHRRAFELRSKLVDEHPDTVDYGRDLADSLTEFASLLGEEGKDAEALAKFREALEVRKRIAKQHPELVDLQSDLANAYGNLAIESQGRRRTAEAGRFHQEAIAIRERIAQRYPDVPDHASALGASYNALGILLIESNRPEEALGSFRKGLAIFEDLERRHPGNLVYRRRLAANLELVANALTNTDDPRSATTYYDRQIAVLGRLAQEFRDRPEYREDLAAGLSNQGIFFQQIGEQDEAERALERSLSIREELVETYPNALKVREGLAVTLLNLGSIRRERRKNAEARKDLARAVAIGRELIGRRPDDVETRNLLGSCLFNLAEVDLGTEDPEAAEASLMECLEIREKLARSHPEVDLFRQREAGALGLLGNLRIAREKWAEALAAFERAATLHRDLMAAHPGMPEYRADLGMDLANMALVDRRQEHWQAARDRLLEALGHLQAARKVGAEHPATRRAVLEALRDLVFVCNRMGDAASAIRQLRSWIDSVPDDAAGLYEGARGLCACLKSVAGAVGRRELADEAVATLERAVRSGWKDGASMLQEQDLAPLHGHPGFDRLVEGLLDRSMPAEPFAR